MARIALTFTWLAVTSCVASAQSGTTPFEKSSRTVTGGVGVQVPVEAPAIGASKGTEILRHRGPTGNACLAVAGQARPHTINPKLYDHVIKVTNSCAQRIALQICYYRSQECISMEIPGGERKEAILGTLPSVKDFRFEFREKF